MAHRFITFSASLAVSHAVSTEKLSCPTLLCSTGDSREDIDPDLCFERELDDPATYFRAYDCEWYFLEQEKASAS